MKKIFFFVILAMAVLLLNGCVAHQCCPTYPSICPMNCKLEVIAGYYVWGEIVINNQRTGQYIDYSIPSQKSTIITVPCCEQLAVWIIDPCGYKSHVETVFTGQAGITKLFFTYW